MSYVDPDGEFAFVPIIVGAIIGTYTGYKVAESKGYDLGDYQTWGYMNVGSIIGGVAGYAGSAVSAAGGGAMLSGAVSGAIGGGGFSALSGNNVLEGAAYGALSGMVGGGFGGAIGGGWGALAGGAASNLTSQLLYNGGDLSSVNWNSVGISGITSFGLYHANSFARWQWGGGKNFGDVELKYGAFNRLNATFTRSRFWYRERGGWITDDGEFVRLKGAVYSKLGINLSNVEPPVGAKYLVHTHYQNNGWLYRQNGLDYEAHPYEPSDPKDYNALDHFKVDGMILTNRSLLSYYQGTTNYYNNWNYPLMRYIPLHFWW